jgi:hypothetical protein
MAARRAAPTSKFSLLISEFVISRNSPIALIDDFSLVDELGEMSIAHNLKFQTCG